MIHSSDSFQINLEAIQSNLVDRIAVLLMISGGLAMWLLTPGGQFSWMDMLFAAAFLGLGTVVYRLRARFHLARRICFIGINLLLFIAMWIFIANWVPFLAPLAIVVSVILSPRRNWLMLLCMTALVVWLDFAGYRQYPLESAIPVILISGLVARITIQVLLTALEWVYSMQKQTNAILEQTREHRAELSRALKSLEIAYTIQNRMQHDLKIAKKMAEDAGVIRQQFAANISHELRTPLSLILGFSEIMYQSSEVYGDMEWPAALRRDIYQIYSNSLHLQKMIDDVLVFSKYDIAEFTLKPERTDMASFLEATSNVARDLFHMTTNTFMTQIAPVLPVMQIDQTRVRQVIFNLINNANRFTDHGIISLKAEFADDMLMIHISDTGIGIPEEKLTEVFDMFYQVNSSLSREHHGAGLGLAICKRFVESHHGKIWAESQAGAGSTFSFSIPIQHERFPEFANLNNREPQEVDTSKPRILVTDPDPLVATMLQRNLPDFELVSGSSPASLGDSIQFYCPQAIIHNVEPGQADPLDLQMDDPILIVKCSLPSQSWQTSFPQVIDRLAKPVSTVHLAEVVLKTGPLHSILIVDDDWGFVQLIQRALEAHQTISSFRIAHNGVLALEAMRAERPDLVLLDIVMPEMGGLEVLKQMNEDPLLSGIPVIVLTGDEIREINQERPQSDVVIQRAGGLTPLEVLTCIKAAVSLSRPVATGRPT